MAETSFHEAFEADFATGILRWRLPPKNHAELVGRVAGYANKGKGKNKDYWQVRLNGRTYKRSRVIFYMAHGKWPEPCVDHIDGDSLNDSLKNLRECNHSQNTANSADKPRRSELPRGVYEGNPGRFMARLTVGGVTKSLGTFSSVEAAKSVYDAAKKEAFHEFA